MAETNTPKTRRHISSIRITDGAALNYTIPLRGELSYTPGGYALVDVKDSNGSFTGLSPTRGEEQPTSFSIEATQRGLGSRVLAADMGLVDFLNFDGNAVGTSTGTESGSVAGEFQIMYSVICTIADHTGTETLTFTRCTFLGSSYASSLEGTKISLSGVSRAAFPTSTFA